jgi:hypothetical protein
VRLIALLLLGASAVSAGYRYKATVTFSAASGSGTNNNITLAFTGSDTKLKTVANGGQIQNTVTRTGVTVPADFVLTNDSTCGSLAGSYTWGIESYSASSGTIVGWVMIPSLNTSASVTLSVCVGNAAVSAYQGGAAGSEFDTNVSAAYHLPDGSTLSTIDFSSNANNGNQHNTPTAVVGEIGGGAGFVAASSQYISGSNIFNGAHATVSGWVNLLAYPSSPGFLLGLVNGLNSGTYDRALSIDSSGLVTWYIYDGGFKSVTSASALGLNAWHDLAGTDDGVNIRLYVDGTQVASGAARDGYTGYSVPNFFLSGSTFAYTYLSFKVDEARLASVARSAGWIATEYANQSGPPAISAFSALAPGVVAAGQLTQSFIF